MRRRDFIKTTVPAAAATLASGYWSEIEAAVAKSANKPIAKRKYKDDVKLSIIGFGAIVLVGQSQRAGNNEVARAYDRGINYYDVAPTYGKGEAELKLGPALKPYRDKVFLACKTQKRDAAGARAELEKSLKTLKTDHFDLYQLHAMRKAEDVDKVFAPGGAMETFLKAQQEGKIRYIGFSAHGEQTGIELLNRFDFDSVLFPINYVCYANGGWGRKLFAKAKEKGAARLALKALAYTPWESKDAKTASGYTKSWYRPIDDMEKARAALRFTLSLDVTSAIPPGSESIYRAAETMGAEFKRMKPDERKALLASAKGLEPLFPRPA
ncbi:MAG: aldo/keto reductase [Puniceicoccaceae bacterium]